MVTDKLLYFESIDYLANEVSDAGDTFLDSSVFRLCHEFKYNRIESLIELLID